MEDEMHLKARVFEKKLICVKPQTGITRNI